MCLSIAFVGSVGYVPVVANADVVETPAQRVIDDMGIGINLGNTLDAYGDWIDQYGDGTPNAYETAWGNPTTTQEIIQGYADEGFGTLRIPVAWSNMMEDDGTYTINSDYMDRVTQVVDWAMDTGMYVIINIHNDGGWIDDLPNDHAILKRYQTMWEQISDHFKDYNDHLIFESQNEELGWSSLWNRWSGTDDGKAQSYSLVNEVNQTFVDIIRSSGGNNDDRLLLISGYNTDVELTCDPLFQMPEDIANMCAVSVHYYTPFAFAGLEEDADWAKARSTWGTDEDFKELTNNMDLMKSTFVDSGIPVIIGEYGCPENNKELSSVRLFLSSVCEFARERDMCPVLWDGNNHHYDRTTYTMKDTVLKDSLLAIRDKYSKTPEVSKGDINLDGKFNTMDILVMKKHLLGIETLSDEQKTRADYNLDGKIDVLDLCLMKRQLLNA